MLIKNGVLYRIYKEDIINGTVTIPEDVTSIGGNAFEQCTSLQEIIIPNTVKKICHFAFSYCSSLRKVILPEGLTDIEMFAFADCTSLKAITFPSTLKYIGPNTFLDCTSLEEISVPENLNIENCQIFEGCTALKTVNLNGMIKNCPPIFFEIFSSQSIKFLDYCLQHNKHLPMAAGVYSSTHPNEIKNFYEHAKDWRDILEEYKKIYIEEFSSLSLEDTDSAIESLYKVCIALGMFQDIKDFAGANTLKSRMIGEISDTLTEDKLNTYKSASVKSVKSSFISKIFIKNYIFNLTPNELIKLFSSLKTNEKGFNQDFADFFINNYTDVEVDDTGKEFFFLDTEIHKEKDGVEEVKEVNLISDAYNRWNEIESVLYNRTRLLSAREVGTTNKNVTVENVIGVLSTKNYFNILPGNEPLAKLCSVYDYSQEQFEKLQEIWEISKKINQDDKLIQAEKDTAEKGIKFELMSNQDVSTLFIGEVTNCCQVISDNGEPCMVYGATKLNSGFINFTLNGQTIGQSWIWYNQSTKTVCLDNIEIPKKLLPRFTNEPKLANSFLKCLKRLAKSIEQAMLAKGLEVSQVTIGAGFNDLSLISSFDSITGLDSPLPKDYALEYPEEKRYSDALTRQYVIPGLEIIEETSSGLTL